MDEDSNTSDKSVHCYRDFELKDGAPFRGVFATYNLWASRIVPAVACSGGTARSCARGRQAETAFTAGVIRYRARRDRLLTSKTQAQAHAAIPNRRFKSRAKAARSRSSKMVSRSRTARSAARIRVDF